MSSDQVAAELRNLAAEIDPDQGELLTLAADALESSGPPPGTLASVDWPSVVADTATREGRWSTAADTTELVRDIFFIAPVAWIWFKLWQAFDNFDGSETAPSFLAQWRDGFGGSGSSFAADAVGVIALVGVIAVLSVAAFVLARIEDKEQNEIRDQLRGLGTRTQVLLAARNTSTDSLSGVQALADQMTRPVSNLVDAVSDLCGQLQPTTDALALHQAEVAAITSGIAEITASSNRISVALDGFVASSAVQLEQLNSSTSVFFADSTAHFEQLNRAANDFQAASAAHFDRLTRAASSAGDAGDRLSASVSTSAATADQLRQQADRLNAATMSLAESADLAARMFTNLRIEIEKLEGRAT